MRLWLSNSQWQLFIMPRREAVGEAVWSWGFYGSTVNAPLFEQASFALEYRRGRTRFIHRPSAQRLVEQDVLSSGQGRVAWMADEQGLYPSLELRLHPSLPVVQWRFVWSHEGNAPVQVERVVLFEVGPLKPIPSSRHRWGLGFIPMGFLRMRRPKWGEVGALRLHPSPGALKVLGPPWPWQETLAEYSLEQPYLPPRQARLPETGEPPPRPEARNHVFSPSWAWLWDADHRRGMAVGVAGGTRTGGVVEVRMEPLHPAVRVWYRPHPRRWEPGHEEVTPWTVLAFFDPAGLEPLEIFWEVLGLSHHPEVVEARRRLHRLSSR